MAYSKQTWSDGKAGATPVNAARLQNIENGLALSGQFLGSGTVFPTTGIQAGDTYLRTDQGTYGSLWQYGAAAIGYNGWISESAIVCTSTTRPSIPYPGLQILESDTLKTWIYGISGWFQYVLNSDTGWISFTPNGPITVGATGCAYRKVNGVVQVHLDGNYNGAYSGGFTFFTLPVGYRPGMNVYQQALPYNSTQFQGVPVVCGTGGNISMNSAGSYSYAGLVLDFTFLAA